MTNRRYSRRVKSNPSATWAQPTLTSPTSHTITSDPATRIISLGSTEDAIIYAPDPISFIGGAYHEDVDAVVTILGGRNVVWDGATFDLTGGPITALTAAVNGTTLTIPADTTGFPSAGWLRVDGELIRYTSKTSTQFNADLRNAGFYNGTTPGNYAHASGATVYLGEYSRSAISLRGQTGHVWLRHIEAKGFVNDGIRINATAPIVTLQDIRIGPVTCHDLINTTDGHADCIQVWERGPDLLRVARATLMAGQRGRSIWDFGSIRGTQAWDLRDVELVDSFDAVNGLLYSDQTTLASWSLYNTWVRSAKRRQIAADVTLAISDLFNVGPVADVVADFVPAAP